MEHHWAKPVWFEPLLAEADTSENLLKQKEKMSENDFDSSNYFYQFHIGFIYIIELLGPFCFSYGKLHKKTFRSFPNSWSGFYGEKSDCKMACVSC